MIDIKFTFTPGIEVVASKFERAHGNLRTNIPKALRIVGAAWLPIARSQAPKRSGRFADGIRYDISETDTGATLTGYAPNPLAKWIIEGTQRHVIPLMVGRGKVLKFLWPSPKGPKSTEDFSAYHFRAWVVHPGTKPNPFHLEAAKRIRPHSVQMMTWVAKMYKADVRDG